MTSAATSVPPPASAEDFSFYRWLSALVDDQGLTVRHLGTAATDLSPHRDQRFTAGVRGMLHWCRVNEEMVIERHGRGAHVVAGFERLSRVRPVRERYVRLASAADRLVLFGQRDAPPGVPAEVVDVGVGPMAREWFLVIASPRYNAMLVARDRDGFGPNGPLQGRRFHGIAVHDTDAVMAAMNVLDGLEHP